MCLGVYWIDVTQDKDKWWALVNMVMNVKVRVKCGECLQ